MKMELKDSYVFRFIHLLLYLIIVRCKQQQENEAKDTRFLRFHLHAQYSLHIEVDTALRSRCNPLWKNVAVTFLGIASLDIERERAGLPRIGRIGGVDKGSGL
jgi:hypothetical protein